MNPGSGILSRKRSLEADQPSSVAAQLLLNSLNIQPTSGRIQAFFWGWPGCGSGSGGSVINLPPGSGSGSGARFLLFVKDWKKLKKKYKYFIIFVIYYLFEKKISIGHKKCPGQIRIRTDLQLICLLDPDCKSVSDPDPKEIITDPQHFWTQYQVNQVLPGFFENRDLIPNPFPGSRSKLLITGNWKILKVKTNFFKFSIYFFTFLLVGHLPSWIRNWIWNSANLFTVQRSAN